MEFSLADGTKMLVAEEQIQADSHLHHSLEQLGFRNIDHVTSHDEALSAIKENKYDVVVCSYCFGSTQGGFFFLETLTSQHLLPLSTVFVFVSEDTSKEVINAVIELQPDEFIALPFTQKNLKTRLSRSLTRKRAFKNVYTYIDRKEYEKAHEEIEHFLLQRKNEAYFPLALKLKGDLLMLTQNYAEAFAHFASIISMQDIGWARLGMASCLLSIDELDEAERLILQLAMRPESELTAYDLLAKLKIKQLSYEDALECTTLVCDMSPHNISRHQQAIDLARITHDYECQFNSAKKLLHYAQGSIRDIPDIYLTAARSGVDFAMTSDPEHVNGIIEQTKAYLAQLKQAHPDALCTDELAVINARLHYIKDNIKSAQALLSGYTVDFGQRYSIEALLDRAKALHEIGETTQSIEIIDAIISKHSASTKSSDLLTVYLKQEQEEKKAISLSPKALNNRAVAQYKKGNVTQSFDIFAQAFRIMPKNPSIALNYLQAILRAGDKNKSSNSRFERTITKCRETLESVSLSDEQKSRYNAALRLLKNTTANTSK